MQKQPKQILKFMNPILPSRPNNKKLKKYKNRNINKKYKNSNS